MNTKQMNHQKRREQAKSDAEFIIRACNAHDELVTAMQSVVDNWTSQFERNGHFAPQWVKQARAALVKAGAVQDENAPSTT